MLSFSGCGVFVRGVQNGIEDIVQSSLFHQGQHGPLTPKEEEWAQIAWNYFDKNYNPKTGLVSNVAGYPSTTLWTIADYISALVSARELQIITPQKFDHRFSQILKFLNTMDLFFGRLPNKAYHTQTGKMVNYRNKPEEIGWSATDLGRLLIWLRIVRERYPEFGEYIDKAVLRCNFCDVIDPCGTLHTGVKVGNEVKLYQEGRLGYEEYAAMGFQAWGFDTTQASNLTPYQKVKIYDIAIYHDARDPRKFGSFAPVVSLPYLLYGLEFNWDSIDDRESLDSYHSNHQISDLASRVYRVQESRYQQDRILTARTDHQLSRPPYFVYDSIFGAGYPWATFNDKGEFLPETSLVSTRATFGLWALWETPYSDLLLSSIQFLHDPHFGWYEGRFEKTGDYEETKTSSTNSMVLESLFHKKFGKIFQVTQDPSYYKKLLADTWKLPRKCFPPERLQCEVANEG